MRVPSIGKPPAFDSFNGFHRKNFCPIGILKAKIGKGVTSTWIHLSESRWRKPPKGGDLSGVMIDQYIDDIHLSSFLEYILTIKKKVKRVLILILNNSLKQSFSIFHYYLENNHQSWISMSRKTSPWIFCYWKTSDEKPDSWIWRSDENIFIHILQIYCINHLRMKLCKKNKKRAEIPPLPNGYRTFHISKVSLPFVSDFLLAACLLSKKLVLTTVHVFFLICKFAKGYRRELHDSCIYTPQRLVSLLPCFRNSWNIGRGCQAWQNHLSASFVNQARKSKKHWIKLQALRLQQKKRNIRQEHKITHVKTNQQTWHMSKAHNKSTSCFFAFLLLILSSFQPNS